MKVHSTMGNGFQEVIYQRAMVLEMPYQSLAFEREKEMSIYYRGVEIGKRRVDFFVEKLIMVELKAVIHELAAGHPCVSLVHCGRFQPESNGAFSH